MSELPKFDELMKLAQNNPEALEALRQEHVNALIDNAPEADKTRLRGLQFQIDAQRKIHNHSPMGACLKISKMMQESFADLRVHLNNLSNTNDPLRDYIDTSMDHSDMSQNKMADILAFPSR
jgi:selenocysteine-specific translation elongation factor